METNNKTLECIRVINARLLKLMFQVYEKSAEIKNILDDFISQGRRYYKDYQIEAGIIYFNDEREDIPLIDGQKFEEADCEWKLRFSHKKMPSKLKTLDLWNNYQSYFNAKGEYFCRAMYDFLCPKIEKDGEKFICWHKIPEDIFPLLNPEDFNFYVELKIGKEKLPTDVTDEEQEEWRYRIHKKESCFPILFEKKRTLHLAKKLLQIELEAAELYRNVKKDFDALEKSGFAPFKEVDIQSPELIYNHHHLFGIKTKEEKIIEKEIEILGTSFALNIDEVSHEKNAKEVLSWFEHYAYLPYDNYYLCYTFHCLNDHCGLSKRQMLKLKSRNFKPGFDIDFEFEEE